MDKNATASVKLKRGNLTASIKHLKQKDWVKLSEKLGLWVPDGGGKGSHKCVYKESDCDRSDHTNLIITIPKKLIPNVQTDKLKQLVAYGSLSGKFTEDDVWKALKLLK